MGKPCKDLFFACRRSNFTREICMKMKRKIFFRVWEKQQHRYSRLFWRKNMGIYFFFFCPTAAFVVAKLRRPFVAVVPPRKIRSRHRPPPLPPPTHEKRFVSAFGKVCIQWFEELRKLCSCCTFYYLGITITSTPKQQQQQKTTALSTTTTTTAAAAPATSPTTTPTTPTLSTTIYLCHRGLQLLLQVRPPEVLLLLLRPPSPLVRPLLHRVAFELDVRRREDRLKLSPWEPCGLGGAAVALLVVAGALAEDLGWGEVEKWKEIVKSHVWSKHYKFNRSLPELEVTFIFWRFFF